MPSTPRHCASGRKSEAKAPVSPRSYAANASVNRSVRSAIACARQESNLRPRARGARPLPPELGGRGGAGVACPPMEVSSRIVTLQLAETFVISRSARDEESVVEVEVRCSGVHGYGEAA